MTQLKIRSEQMEAFRTERRRAVARQVAGRITTRWPSLLAHPARPIDECITHAFAWAEHRRVSTPSTFDAVAAVFAVYGPPPWHESFAEPLADLHLAPSDRAHAFATAAAERLDTEERARACSK